MGEAKRRSYTGAFKAKVGLEAIRGAKTVNEIGQAYGVHPAQVGQWKKEILERAATLFESKRGPKKAEGLGEPERLYGEIGRLKMELDWLKKTVLRGAPRTCRRRNSFGRAKVVVSPRAEAVYFLVACEPGKKLGPGTVAHLRVVTPAGDPD